MAGKQIFAAVLLLFWAFAKADTPQPDARLFESNDVLDVRIVAPFDVITHERPTDEHVQGKLHYSDTKTGLTELDVGIRTRGNFRRRRDVCQFPPLRLNFSKSQVAGTVFAGQDKLKLAANCVMGSFRYEQALLAEYLAYRILNELTDISFRVRLLQIQFENSESGNSFSGFGILIEHKDSLAQRIGAAPISTESIDLGELDGSHLNITSVFQYLIGNTDFAATAGTAGEDCCHNYELFGTEGQLYHSVPYDFDMSGFVDAPYAIPNSALRLDSVKERMYRGFCANNDQLPQTLQLISDSRDRIESLLRDFPQLSDNRRSDALKYIDSFYRSVSSDRGINRNLVRKCR